MLQYREQDKTRRPLNARGAYAFFVVYTNVINPSATCFVAMLLFLSPWPRCAYA
jgi:hypothetical protein